MSEGRVLMFQIPPAPQGLPIAWKRHYYGRDGESLAGLNLQEIETIRGNINDWSEDVCPDATLYDLDLKAIEFARVEFIKKHPALEEEIKKWDDKTFFNKAKLTIKGKLTKAIILSLLFFLPVKKFVKKFVILNIAICRIKHYSLKSF